MPGRGQFMSRATRTTTARKAMRAATVFTGAAGLAVAFGPGAAMAAAGHAPARSHPARAAGTTPAHIRLTAADIESRGCTTNTWLHIEYSSVVRSLCKQYGYSGSAIAPLGMYMTAQCGGNNYGDIATWASGSYPFGPGKTYRSINGWVFEVDIYSWKGADKCAWPR
jgi:hypothetical protein